MTCVVCVCLCVLGGGGRERPTPDSIGAMNEGNRASAITIFGVSLIRPAPRRAKIETARRTCDRA